MQRPLSTRGSALRREARMKGEKRMSKKRSSGSEAGKLSLNHAEMRMLARRLDRVNFAFFWVNLQVTSGTHDREVTSPGMELAMETRAGRRLTYGDLPARGLRCPGWLPAREGVLYACTSA